MIAMILALALVSTSFAGGGPSPDFTAVVDCNKITCEGDNTPEELLALTSERKDLWISWQAPSKQVTCHRGTCTDLTKVGPNATHLRRVGFNVNPGTRWLTSWISDRDWIEVSK